MKPVWRWVIVMSAMLVGVQVGAQTNAQAPISLPQGSALVVDVKGEVAATMPQGGLVHLQKGQVVTSETTIETGKGSLVLAFVDGSQVLLKAQCRVVIKTPEQASGNFLQLLMGRLLAKVQKRLGQEPSFKLGTPTAVIAVRGTFFGVEVSKKDRTYVQVYEGLVAVTAINVPGAPVMLRPGYATQIDLDRRPRDPHPMQDPERYTNPGPGGEDNGQGAREKIPGRPEGDSGSRSGNSESQSTNPKQQQQQNPQREGPD